MSTVLTFQVLGDPKGQPRPRAFAMRTAMGGYTARVFDAGTAEGWKSLIALAAKNSRPPAPILGPVKVTVGFVFRRPNAHYRGSKVGNPLRAGAPTEHTSKPDIDNLVKALLDAITQTGLVWRDDTQVSHLASWKAYGDKPGAVVEIRTLEELNTGGVAA